MALDLTTHCALCGGSHRISDEPWARPRDWCGDDRESDDHPNLLCRCWGGRWREAEEVTK